MGRARLGSGMHDVLVERAVHGDREAFTSLAVTLPTAPTPSRTESCATRIAHCP